MTTPALSPNDDDDRPEAVVIDFPSGRTSSDAPADTDTTGPAHDAVPTASDISEFDDADAVRVDPDVSEPGYLDRARTAVPP